MGNERCSGRECWASFVSPTYELKEVSVNGQRLELVENEDGRRRWEARIGGDRVIEFSVYSASSVQSTSVTYRVEKPEVLTQAQKRRMGAQSAFYERYDGIAKNACSTSGRKRLSRAERIIVLAGELEAEVNNGGFSQYLLNKGRRRARQALDALRAVGAERTATLLEQALQVGRAEAESDRLDTKYYRQSEDLATLVMKHLQLVAR
ncbi:hypothetical protein GCM10027343_02370 [Noviherbaspirillum agri]